MTKDKAVTAALGDALGCSKMLLPERELVPIELTYEKNGIRIVSPEGEVNTTISWHGIFQSAQELKNVNQLLVVQEGVTEITYYCREMIYGAALSCAGVVLMGFYLVRNRRKKPGKEATGS